MFLRFFTLLLIFSSFDVYAASCQSQRPSTTLHEDVSQVEYIRTSSAKDLTSARQEGLHTVLGLAGGPIGTRFEAKFSVMEVGHHIYCLNVMRIDAVFFAKPQIHIASNFARGSCEYNEVLIHEQQHVNILQQFFNEYSNYYGGVLRDVGHDLPKFNPVKLQNIEEQKRLIIKQIEQELYAYMDEITEILAERQAEIDTPEEYARVASRCSRWQEKIDDE